MDKSKRSIGSVLGSAKARGIIGALAGIISIFELVVNLCGEKADERSVARLTAEEVMKLVDSKKISQ